MVYQGQVRLKTGSDGWKDQGALQGTRECCRSPRSAVAVQGVLNKTREHIEGPEVLTLFVLECCSYIYTMEWLQKRRTRKVLYLLLGDFHETYS